MIKSFLSFLFKSDCALCEQKTSNLICEYCYQKLVSCQLSNSIIKTDKDYSLFIWGRYDNYVKRAIFTFKYDNKTELGEVFGQFLARAWLDNKLWKKGQKITIVPVPLHDKKLRERGFNQAELVAKSFCEITGYSHFPHLLTRVKNTDAMFSLNPIERKQNITQAFTVGKDYPKFNRQHSVIILDDIYTTGATVEEVIRVLNTLQIKVLGVMAIASSLNIKDHE